MQAFLLEDFKQKKTKMVIKFSTSFQIRSWRRVRRRRSVGGDDERSRWMKQSRRAADRVDPEA
jgi:RIO-like serine/threonine protein kinase